MDTSKEYIKMCEKSTEIQQTWNKKDGDFFRCKWLNYRTNKWIYETAVLFESKEDPYHSIPSNFDNIHCWLPRQDQIQSLMYSPFYKETIFIDDFYKFSKKSWDKFSTMDQLWLAYYMNESYSKVWNGSDWIKKY